MKAVCWNGVNDLRVETVPDPKILNPHDAIFKVTLSSVCGSDLHLLDGFIPTMKPGDIIGHEFLGEVVEIGREVKDLRPGDRAIVISIIGCGQCFFCKNELWSCCDNSNPKPDVTHWAFGKTPAGIFGYSHAFGGYAGSHAEYIRVPFADHGAIKVPDGVTDEQAVFVSDAAPTGYMGADLADIQPGDVVAVWGCGGVGQMAIRSAYLRGAERVIAIDRFPDRLQMAAEKGGAEVLNYMETNVYEALEQMTGGRGPDRCIEAVGMEAHGTGPGHWYDTVATNLYLETDRATPLRQAILTCRKGGTVSVVGVYGLTDKFPMGAIVNKSLTLRSAQQHGQKYARRLFEHIAKGELDPSYLLTHRWPLERGPEGYQMFKHKVDNCMRVAFAP
ncbi:MAG: glutathione-dependent formaldehyde dehydrogenase [Isosphaeraceae bacterium]|nr:glutathione-dependent formaldehyde dehydrogenase [Isosphaeraceae bacterium]